MGTVSKSVTLVLAAARLGACGGYGSDGTGLGHGPAARIAKNTDDGQRATVGTAVLTPPSVLITDADDRPVPGTMVTFAVASGGGAVAPTTPVSSDASGVARLTAWTLGATPGSNTVTAAAPGLSGSPVTFSATAQTGTSSPVIKVGNGSQLVFVADQVTIPLAGSVTWEWNSGSIAHRVSTSSGSPAVPGTPSATPATPYTFGPVTFSMAGTYRFTAQCMRGRTALREWSGRSA